MQLYKNEFAQFYFHLPEKINIDLDILSIEMENPCPRRKVINKNEVK